MGFNKDIIFRFLFSIGLILFIIRVLFPIILDKFRGKSLGLSKDSHDLDYLIKAKKEQLKSSTGTSNNENNSKNLIQSEFNWGGQKIINEIKSLISKNFGHGFSETKITKYITFINKNKGIQEIINSEKDYQSIINFLTNAFILNEILNEIKNEELHFTEKCAKKIQISPVTFALAIQIKVLKEVKKSEPDVNEYLTHLNLKEYSEEKIAKANISILISEGQKWFKGISTFYEELSLNITYAQFLTPLIPPKNNQDLYIAFKNLNINEKENFDEIKKRYKKIALQLHPDKIIPLKLPKMIEKQAIENFNIIQKSYEIIAASKKNE